jgi:NitT/TauT family transport system substrate-binding protein
MARFRIMPHGRLQEWVAEEKRYFADEGLQYEFVHDFSTGTNRQTSPSNAEPSGVREVRQGAYESMQAGRACDVSSACHWAVNIAASSRHGRMWGHAYAVTPSGIYVPPESPVRMSRDLANVEVAVGFHSGSHFSALQALENILHPSDIKLHFVGRPLERMALLLDRQVAAANVFGVPMYVLEQQGFRRIVDTTFMIGFLLQPEANEVKIPAASCGAFREPHQTSSVAHFEDFSGTGYTDE